MSDFSELNRALTERQANHLYRKRRTLETAQGAQVVMDGSAMINFCSNDYLGLANHPEVIGAFQQAANQFGVGSGSSHLVCGHSSLHHQLEQQLADFVGRDRALLFSNGYMANLGVVNALLGKTDYVFEDKLNHASLLDAGLLSGARFQRFVHNDVANLETKLARAGNGRKLIVVDSVFSMDGDIAPLDKLSALAAKYGAWLMADDAHGIGVLGNTGAGSAEHFQLQQDQLQVVMGTLGKGFGAFGAFVAGSEALIETLIQFARPYIYTTALPPAIAAANIASLQVIRNEPQRRQYLLQLIAQFKQRAAEQGLPLMPSNTAIQPLLVGDSQRALQISEGLAQRGFLVAAIRPPTVPANSARLRVTITAAHTQQQIDRLVEALVAVMASVKVEGPTSCL